MRQRFDFPWDQVDPLTLRIDDIALGSIQLSPGRRRCRKRCCNVVDLEAEPFHARSRPDHSGREIRQDRQFEVTVGKRASVTRGDVSRNVAQVEDLLVERRQLRRIVRHDGQLADARRGVSVVVPTANGKIHALVDGVRHEGLVFAAVLRNARGASSRACFQCSFGRRSHIINLKTEVVDSLDPGSARNDREIDLTISEIDCEFSAISADVSQDFRETERRAIERRDLFLPVTAHCDVSDACHAEKFVAQKIDP